MTFTNFRTLLSLAAIIMTANPFIQAPLALAAPASPALTPPSSISSPEPHHAKLHKSPTAQDVIAALNLIPNPEKGYFAETFRDVDNITSSDSSSRSASTAIYYLLEGNVGDSVWHRVDAAEVWHYYAGAPMVLSMSRDDGSASDRRVLGGDVVGGQRPQVVVPKGRWQSARSLGDWTLVGTTVAPGFVETGVELAPEDWVPNGA